MRRVVAAAVALFALFVVVPKGGDALETCVSSRMLKTGYCIYVPNPPDPTSVE